MKKASNHPTKKCLLLKKEDNVALALEDLKPGDTVVIDDENVVMTQPIKFGHKFAVTRIEKGENIVKHGEVIGKATCDIMAEEHVHVHNVESLRAKGRSR